jgi:hypothetical protein
MICEYTFVLLVTCDGEVVYKARTREAIMYGIDEFLDQVTVLPPGQWDPQIRIEPPEKVPSQVTKSTNVYSHIITLSRSLNLEIIAISDQSHFSRCNDILYR